MSSLKSFEYARDILKGCGFETQLAELGGILRNLANAVAAGEINDNEFREYVEKLCESIAELASRCDKSVSIEICIDELAKRIKADSLAGIGFSLMETFRQRLRKGRKSFGEGAAASPGIFG